MYKTGTINLNDVTEQLNKITADKTYLENRLKEISKNDTDDDLFAAKKSANKMLKLLKNKIDSCEVTQELKKNIINMIIDRINLKTVGEGRFADVNVSIHYKFHKMSYPTKVINYTDRLFQLIGKLLIKAEVVIMEHVMI